MGAITPHNWRLERDRLVWKSGLGDWCVARHWPGLRAAISRGGGRRRRKLFDITKCRGRCGGGNSRSCRRAAVVKADVSEPEDVESMIGFIRERFGRLDILISNAASGGFRPALEATPRHFSATMETNVLPLLTLVQNARGLLQREQGRSKVVALSSHGSHRALPHYALIGASKAALESLVRHLALEMGDHGVNVNCVLAGLVETDSTRGFPGAEVMFEAVRQRQMTGSRPLLPQDVANSVLFLVSDLSDQVQGQTLVVDGGEGIRG